MAKKKFQKPTVQRDQGILGTSDKSMFNEDYQKVLAKSKQPKKVKK